MMESQDNATKDEAAGPGNPVGQDNTDKTAKVKVIYKFCDLQQKLVDAWKDQFKNHIPDRVQVYKGDIFREGPAADAIVSPANSFGFMDGGIDMAYSRHFGWQMQDRLQKVIQEQYHGELLVGEAAIITTVEHHNRNSVDWSQYNEGQPIKYLISAPTMRVPLDVSDTVNAYLAFRAIILAVEKFNATNTGEPIRSVLCPGLGTAVGCMPRDRCACQMLEAFERFDLARDSRVLKPDNLALCLVDHYDLAEFGGGDIKQGPPKDKPVMRATSKTKKQQTTKKKDDTACTAEAPQKGSATVTLEKGSESTGNTDKGLVDGANQKPASTAINREISNEKPAV